MQNKIVYGYERVSSKEQNLDRQDIAIKQYRPDIKEDNIFKDKLTGKTFDRPQYNLMKNIIEHMQQTNDKDIKIELVIEELDRLGRNAEKIKKELEWFKEHNIIVRILEIPTTLIEVDNNNKWVMQLINQIIIEVYSAIAEEELNKRQKRQREGIEAAKEKGIHLGRKPIEVNREHLQKVYISWINKEITSKQAMTALNLKPNTFYRRIAELEAELTTLASQRDKILSN